jgi:hypothetical protein
MSSGLPNGSHPEQRGHDGIGPGTGSLAPSWCPRFESGSASRPASVLRRHVDQPVEREPAGAFAAPVPRRMPSHVTVRPPRQRVRWKLCSTCVPARGTSSLWTRYPVGVAGGSASSPSRSSPVRGLTTVVGAPGSVRGRAARWSWTSRVSPGTCAGKNGIQCSGTVETRS